MVNQRDSSEVYAIHTGSGFLVYSPLRGISALVNRSALRELSGFGSAGTARAAGEGIDGLCREIQESELVFPPQCVGPIQPAFLGLIPTRRCNGNCGYCDFGAGRAQPGRMQFRTATAAVDWMADTVVRRGGDRLEVHFFGGEPLIEPEVVEVAVHRARLVADQNALTPQFETATNGVIGEDLAGFLGDYFDSVVLSMDGFAAIHDRQRPLANGRGSFEAAGRTAEIISDRSARLCLRCCVSDQNVDELPGIAAWFAETFRPSTVIFEPMQVGSDSLTAGLSPPDPVRFARGFLRATRMLDPAGIDTAYSALSPDGPRFTSCPVGRDVVIVSPDGRLAGCYQLEERWRVRGLDFRLGEIRDGEVRIEQESVERLRQLILDKPRCRNCFCRWECAGSCHVSVTYPGCPAAYPDFCVQTRLIFACRALQDLGRPEVADKLLADSESVARLAQLPSDRLEDWSGE